MVSTKEKPSLRDVLYELALSDPVPDAGVLDDFIRRYPEHTTALTEFAVALALDALQKMDEHPSEPPLSVASPMVSRAMSRFHNRLYAVKTAAATQVEMQETEAKNPFISLKRDELRAFVQRLGINTVFFMKLRDRLIQFDTIPQGFLRRVAEELKETIEVVMAHFAGHATMQRHAYFKADQKPEAGAKQTFDEAVRNSSLTLEQQEYLLNL